MTQLPRNRWHRSHGRRGSTVRPRRSKEYDTRPLYLWSIYHGLLHRSSLLHRRPYDGTPKYHSVSYHPDHLYRHGIQSRDHRNGLRPRLDACFRDVRDARIGVTVGLGVRQR